MKDYPHEMRRTGPGSDWTLWSSEPASLESLESDPPCFTSQAAPLRGLQIAQLYVNSPDLAEEMTRIEIVSGTRIRFHSGFQGFCDMLLFGPDFVDLPPTKLCLQARCVSKNEAIWIQGLLIHPSVVCFPRPQPGRFMHTQLEWNVTWTS